MNESLAIILAIAFSITACIAGLMVLAYFLFFNREADVPVKLDIPKEAYVEEVPFPGVQPAPNTAADVPPPPPAATATAQRDTTKASTLGVANPATLSINERRIRDAILGSAQPKPPKDEPTFKKKVRPQNARENRVSFLPGAPKRAGKKWTQAEKDRLIILWSSGHTITEIAEQMGRTYSSILNKLSLMSLIPRGAKIGRNKDTTFQQLLDQVLEKQ